MEKGAISDQDETVGDEYEAKRASPVKGNVRVTSTVSSVSRLKIIYSLLCDRIK